MNFWVSVCFVVLSARAHACVLFVYSVPAYGLSLTGSEWVLVVFCFTAVCVFPQLPDATSTDLPLLLLLLLLLFVRLLRLPAPRPSLVRLILRAHAVPAYGGLIIVRFGRWALLLLLLLSPDQQQLPLSSLLLPESPEIADTTVTSSGFVEMKKEQAFFVGEGMEDGGGVGGGRGVVMASEESLAVALVVAAAAAAVCYTSTGALWIRRLVGYRLVSNSVGGDETTVQQQ